MFPIEDLRQAVETEKRILTKEKLDRQLTGHTSSSPFMSIREGQNNGRVSFDTREELGDKIDKLVVMIGKLAAKDNGKVRPNPRYTKIEVEVKIEDIIKEIIRVDIGQTTG